MDYLGGLMLIVAPWLLGFARGGAETWVPVTLGVVMLVASALTRYELGLVRVIPMPVHLSLDIVLGAFLALSPWLLGFAPYVWAPHLVFGLLEIGAGLCTETRPRTLPVPRENIVTDRL
jgi:hypothetical protein